MNRTRRIGVTAVAALAALAGSPGLAQAQHLSPAQPLTASADGALPPGWRVTGKGVARELVWRSDRAVPMGDARVEFYADGRLIGVPKAEKDGHTFRLALRGAVPLKGLQVRAAGRRLDTVADSTGRKPKYSPAVVQPPAQLPANSMDPGEPGDHRTVTDEYNLDPVKLPGFAQPVEMRAVVIAPVGLTGKRPLALFLHGRHFTCYKPGGSEYDVSADWPCAAGMRPVPSYKGYLKDQKLLASQGYVTVSISANGINAQDWNAEDGGAQARSSLVRQHLAKWAGWAAHPGTAPAAVPGAAEADLSRVLLVGHSRGGDGVNRAAMDSLYPSHPAQDGYRGPVQWKIRGTVHIGPTITGQNPVADVPSTTILPGCDGDVSDLQGEVYVDGTRRISQGTALHSAVYMVGANHNFFNTEWTPGKSEAPSTDDFWDDAEQRDPVCSMGARTRLTADQQHQAGATYIAAAARLFVAGDDRVRPLLDGSGRRAPSADPARVLTHAVGARRIGGFLPDTPMRVTGGRLCSAIDLDPATACLDPDTAGSSPHFARWQLDKEAGRSAVALRWSAPGTATTVRPATSVSLSGASSLALRVFVPPNTTGTKLDVAVTDSSGHRAELGPVQIDGLPGTERTASYWARELRVPLTAATRAGLDLGQVRSLELTPRSQSGQAWLMDAWGWAPGTPAVTAAALPRVDIGRLTVNEGDEGTVTYHIPVQVSGQGSGKVRFSIIDPDTGQAEDKLVTVRAGRNPIDVPVVVKGNTRFGRDEQHDLLAKAVRGAVVGSYVGGVTVLNDDPAPSVTLTPVTDRVVEGGTLRWRISLSEPADVDIWQPVRVLPVTEGTELSTKDVDPQWLMDLIGGSNPSPVPSGPEPSGQSGDLPDPERPLSEANLWVWMRIPAGAPTADFIVPTVKNELTKPPKYVRIALTGDDAEPLPGHPVLTGTVVDAL
ncbi:hypothetical protein ACWDAO_06910 [Streptomyces sp. NPDC001212]